MRPMMDKDALAAFVDGALSPEEAATLVMHLADHPADQAYVDNLFAANEALAAAFEAPLHEPVPEAIRAAILGAREPKVTVLPYRLRARAAGWIGGVLALAAAVAGLAVLLPGPPGPATGALLAVGPLDEGTEMAALVGTVPSLQPEVLAGGQEAMILATMRMADGRFCREVEVMDRVEHQLNIGLACTLPQGGWSVEVVLQEPLGDDPDAFVTAAGPEAHVLAQFLDRHGAGAVLDPEAEQQAILTGWSD